jgi:NADH-quinone oxidoreductase subunit H
MHVRNATHPLLRHATALLMFVFMAIGLTACGDPPTGTVPTADVRVEPGILVFHPETQAIDVSIVNTGEEPIAIGAFAIEAKGDWEAFDLDPINTTEVDPEASVAVRVRLSDLTPFRKKIESIVARDSEPEEFEFGDEEEADDILPPGEYRDGSATLTFVADGVPQRVAIRFEQPGWFWQYFLPALAKVLLIVLGFVMPLASLLTWIERKQSAMMQDRLGPNMARLQFGNFTLRVWGLLHIVTDAIKMLFKEDFIPRRAHRVLYTLAPLMALIPALVVFAIVPFGDALCYGQLFDVVSQADVDQCAAGRGGTPLQIAKIDVGLLFYFAIASLATWGATLAGWASYNKWAILGALRASAQMISYEVAIGLTIVGALLVYGTLEPHALVHAQTATYWGIVLQPIAFVLFFTAAIAETKRAPFDLPEGESEIIGYFIEYSGMRFGLFFLSEFIEVIFVGALVTTLFLGGWTLPMNMLGAQGFQAAWMAQVFFLGGGIVITLTGVGMWRASKQSELLGVAVVCIGLIHVTMAVYSAFTGWGTELPHVVIVLVGMLTWGIKVMVLCWLQLLIRWTLPRFRYDQLMGLGWKGLLPLSIANIVLTAVIVYFLPQITGPDTEPELEQPAAAAPAEEAPPPDEAPAEDEGSDAP